MPDVHGNTRAGVGTLPRTPLHAYKDGRAGDLDDGNSYASARDAVRKDGNSHGSARDAVGLVGGNSAVRALLALALLASGALSWRIRRARRTSTDVDGRTAMSSGPAGASR